MQTFITVLIRRTGRKWQKDYKMIFDYRRFFMGSKFAIFNYATKNTGGFVDVDFLGSMKLENNKQKHRKCVINKQRNNTLLFF